MSLCSIPGLKILNFCAIERSSLKSKSEAEVKQQGAVILVCFTPKVSSEIRLFNWSECFAIIDSFVPWKHHSDTECSGILARTSLIIGTNTVCNKNQSSFISLYCSWEGGDVNETFNLHFAYVKNVSQSLCRSLSAKKRIKWLQQLVTIQHLTLGRFFSLCPSWCLLHLCGLIVWNMMPLVTASEI